MKEEDRFPIDRIPERDWARVKDAVFAELDAAPAVSRPPRARRPRAVVWAVGAAAAAALVLVGYLLAERPDSSSLSSTRVVTGDDASETLLGDVSVHVEPQSSLFAVASDGRGQVVVLEQGAATFAVPPREARPPFVVQGGDVRVEVIGTRFRVERTGPSARVDTHEGTVRVVVEGRAISISAGESWPSGEDAADARATPEGSAEAAISEATLEPNADERQGAFERAASLEATDAEAAARIYGRLVDEGSEWEANALFALGRLELERGRHGVARSHLARYLERFPRGVNAADARALLARIPSHDPNGERP
jgi:hypothetical protein